MFMHYRNPAQGNQLTNRRTAQRKSLGKVLSLPAGHNAADTLLNDPTCQILELSALDAITVQPRQLHSWALVCRAWAAAVKAWLASTAAMPFWQRACAGMLPPEAVLHPELCTKDMLREWAALPMAVGTRHQWHRCGLGMAQSEEESEAMTELELGIALAQLFKLWWNVGDDSHTSPRFVGWMRLYFRPYLNGRTHDTERRPGIWELNQASGGPIPMSLLANVCDCIQDFRMCPMAPNIPELIENECISTLRALIAKFDCQTPRGTQWRCMRAPQITPAKNATFYSILKRYCPLFPQLADTEPRVAVTPVYKRGERHSVPMPRPECWRLWPHPSNMFLILDKSNTDSLQEYWEWDTDVMNRDEHGVIEVPAGRGLSREAGMGVGGALASNSALGMGIGDATDSLDSLNLAAIGIAADSIKGGGGGGAPAHADGSSGLFSASATNFSSSMANWAVDVADHVVEEEPSSAGVVGASSPTRMQRAREWTIEVENQYRLQEAGYRDETEALSLGHPPVERWPEVGLIRKLVTKETLGKETASLIYFKKRRECEDKDINKVKLYSYA